MGGTDDFGPGGEDGDLKGGGEVDAVYALAFVVCYAMAMIARFKDNTIDGIWFLCMAILLLLLAIWQKKK